MKLLRVSAFVCLVACATTNAWAQYGLYGAGNVAFATCTGSRDNQQHLRGAFGLPGGTGLVEPGSRQCPFVCHA